MKNEYRRLGVVDKVSKLYLPFEKDFFIYLENG